MEPAEILLQAGLQHGRLHGRIDYNVVPSSIKQSSHSLQQVLVFVNGLMLPQEGWFPVMADLIRKCQTANSPFPAMLSYDRAGQGRSGPHPKDENPEPDSEPGYRHDCQDSAAELEDLICHILQHPIFTASKNAKMILVCNSIGCPIGRLYAQQHRESIVGLIFLDSNITNTDFVSIWPDPDSPSFDASSLPQGIDPDGLRLTRMKFSKAFHPSVSNPEGLNRRNLSELLPQGDEPSLYESRSKGPFVTVVGHDPRAFAEQSQAVSSQHRMFLEEETIKRRRKELILS
ncbi:MAG: hypothetical protein Q9157_003550 [Trypethelium eluteriae]